jgi:hypothetical protein
MHEGFQHYYWTSSSGTALESLFTQQLMAAAIRQPNTKISGHRLDTHQNDVQWLHRESGLTWDQLGRIFGVSRRAVHLWATGGRMNASHAETLAELLAIVRTLPASNRADRRAALLAQDATGRSVLDRLRNRHASGGDVAGTPWSPEQLLGARHDRPQTT